MQEQFTNEAKKREATDRFPCSGCGANMLFDPESQSLTCSYCSSKIDIEGGCGEIKEYDFNSAEESMSHDWGNETRVIHCESCGAETVLDLNSTAQFCAFCGSSHIVRNEGAAHIVPESLVPFKITQQKAVKQFGEWIRKKLFAPNSLKNSYQSERIKGVYIPCWTYDSETYSTYTGEGGTYYYETVTEWVQENGKRVMRTRQVRKIRWWPTSGTYSEFFDDVLVNASKQIDGRMMDKLEPFNLNELVQYKPEFLSGFLAERYSIGFKDGWETAKVSIDNDIRSGVIRKINADEVRNLRINTFYDKVKFKHILLPVWISAYKYKNKLYRYMVNGQTGEVQGQAPVSFWKVALAVILGAAVIGIAAAVIKHVQ